MSRIKSTFIVLPDTLQNIWKSPEPDLLYVQVEPDTYLLVYWLEV